MKSNIYFICVLILSLRTSAQQQTITEKYWNYRNNFNQWHIIRGVHKDPFQTMGGLGLPIGYLLNLSK